MWGSRLCKERRIFAIVVLITLLITVGSFSVFLYGQYPQRIEGIYFDLGNDIYLDEYSISDIWELFNNSQISENYTVELRNSQDDYWYSHYLEIDPQSEPYMKIFFTQDREGDSYFWGHIEYEVQYPGLSDGYQEADDTMRKEMGIILDALGEPGAIEYYNSGDNDFSMIDNTIHSLLFFGGWALVITYLFIMLFDGGKIFNGFFGGGTTITETATPFLMFLGIWALLMVMYINISGRWIISVHTVCYTVGGVLVLVPLTVLLMDRKRRQKFELIDFQDKQFD